MPSCENGNCPKCGDLMCMGNCLIILKEEISLDDFKKRYEKSDYQGDIVLDNKSEDKNGRS